MARPDALVPGNCYFLLQFHDQELLVPQVTTLTYAGTDTDDEGRRVWVFHEPPSPDAANGTEAEEDSPSFFAFADEELHEILDFPVLLRALAEVAADHPIHPPAPAPPSQSADDPFADLQSRLAQFVDNPELVGLTITILFTDDGLSFNRGDEGMEVSFFLSTKREAEQEAAIRALFAAMTVAPRADHLSSNGRTRILSFPVAANAGEMASLGRRILKDVYAMRDSDSLRFSPLAHEEIDRA